MASYFEIYDDKENKAAAGKPQTRKFTRSILGEISQNTTRRSKRIARTNGSQVFPNVGKRQENANKSEHSNKENSLPSHLVAKSSKTVRETRVPFSVITDTPDDKTDEYNRDSESSLSVHEDSKASSVLFNSSKDEEAAAEETFTDNILTVVEYSKEIYKFLKDREGEVMPKWNYMERQTEVTYSMRAILVDWLVEVAEEYSLGSESIHLAVSYIDRFLSRMSVERSKLQLVGAGCMFLAAKYQEIYPPGVKEFAFITDNTYTNKQVLRMEHLVLKVLGFDISAPTSHYFVNQFCQMFNMEDKALHLSLYLAELSLLDGATFLKFPPSLKAASSVVLARHTLGMEAWSDAMAGVVGYSLEDLKECVVGLYDIFVAAPDLDQKAVQEKYKKAKFASVAEVTPVDIM